MKKRYILFAVFLGVFAFGFWFLDLFYLFFNSKKEFIFYEVNENRPLDVIFLKEVE
jgi:hypothetical protein